MMASPREKAAIRSFVCEQLRAEPDLSVLTVAILRKRYLAQVKSDSLSTEARLYLKEVVQKELIKMLDNDDSGSDVENRVPQNKRKREEENEEIVDDKSTAKKSRLRSNSSEESEKDESASSDPGVETDQNESESEKDEQEGEKSNKQKTDRKTKREPDSEDSSDEESVEKANESDCNDSPSKTVKSEKDEIKKETTESPSQGKTALQSELEGDSASDCSSHKNDDNKGSSSSDDSDEEEAPAKKKETEITKDENPKQKRGSNTNDKKQENKTIVRLKHHIVLCGVRRNYKKLFSNCKSVKSKIDVLKKELEDIGIEGSPTIEKCKKLKKNREQEQEIAELDVGNIITTEGRSRRRGTLAQLERVKPLSSAHVRSLNSDSESDEENRTRHKRKTDWGNLRGVISDDASSE